MWLPTGYPGGVAAIVGGAQPLIVALLASRFLREKLTATRLLAGGATLAIALMVFEGLPTEPLTVPNVLGYPYLSVMGTALAYFCWFRGLPAAAR
ncbi:hypothetical protein AAGW05_01115 [Arthrobacter sp. LAPM80]|uniref:hypothetical protein n=1 Tax=Arthrobacter sp. LAPM80 TaxID=3141788 RepID=UPI00398B0543